MQSVLAEQHAQSLHGILKIGDLIVFHAGGHAHTVGKIHLVAAAAHHIGGIGLDGHFVVGGAAAGSHIAVNGGDETYWMKDVTAHDLVKYGIIPELIGRLPVITALSGLDTDALVQILTVPKNSIVQQYKKLFELDNVELVFEDDALKAVAKKAQEQRTGARGLRGIMEGILTNLMFEIPSDPTIERVTITEKVVTEGSEPELLRNEDKAAVSINLKQDAKKRQKRSTAS